MEPTNELLVLAIEKARKLEAGTHIRLTADPKSWYVYNFHGKTYIGYTTEENTGKFFKHRSEYQMLNKEGKLIAKVQHLFINEIKATSWQ